MITLTNDSGKTVKLIYSRSIDHHYDEDLGRTVYEVGMPTIMCDDPRDAECLRVQIQKAVNNMARAILED